MLSAAGPIFPAHWAVALVTITITLALNAFENAIREAPDDVRLRYECDQLWKRLGRSPADRIERLEQRLDLVQNSDDLSLEYCALLNQVGRSQDAEAILQSRIFQPWEGGEGVALGQHVRTNLLLGRKALDHGDAKAAVARFSSALASPSNLGEAKHLLANQSDIHYWLGCAVASTGNDAGARRSWQWAADFRGDFQNMEVQSFSEMTYYSALAMRKLGREEEANGLLEGLLAYAKDLEAEQAKIDYFATSLPTMLLFEADIQFDQVTTALFLQAQAKLGLGDAEAANALLKTVLDRNPNHALAQDLVGRS